MVRREIGFPQKKIKCSYSHTNVPPHPDRRSALYVKLCAIDYQTVDVHCLISYILEKVTGELPEKSMLLDEERKLSEKEQKE